MAKVSQDGINSQEAYGQRSQLSGSTKGTAVFGRIRVKDDSGTHELLPQERHWRFVSPGRSEGEHAGQWNIKMGAFIASR